LQTWLISLAAVLVLLAGWEMTLRGCGFRPSADDDAGLWVRNLRQVRDYDPRAVVLIGASRSQLGLDPVVLGKALANRLGDTRPVQLSIVGSSPMPVLEYFAAHEGFRGMVICDVTEHLFFSASSERERPPREYLAKAQELNGFDLWQLELRDWLHSRLVCLNSEVCLLAGQQLLRGLVPRPYQHVRADRCRESSFDPEAHRKVAARFLAAAQRAGQPFLQPELDRFLDRVEEQVARIQGRGGRVVFVRLPSSGAIRAAEQRRLPRARYWDRLQKRTSGLCIHYEDHAPLRAFDCPDGSHLDHVDAVVFTQAFARILAEQLN
jgi:hypothetical protein